MILFWGLVVKRESFVFVMKKFRILETSVYFKDLLRIPCQRLEVPHPKRNITKISKCKLMDLHVQTNITYHA